MHSECLLPKMLFFRLMILAVPLCSAGQAPGVDNQRPVKPLVESGQFDIISIKASNPADTTVLLDPNPNDLVLRGVSLEFVIQYAYALHPYQIQNLPKWAESEHFDIRAKMDIADAESAAPKAGSREVETEQQVLEHRLQALLLSRFNLKVHQAYAEKPVYFLTVAGRRPKLMPSSKSTGSTFASGLLVCSSASMSDLASLLSETEDRVVVDHTHLVGTYSFTLKWTPLGRQISDAEIPALPTALKEQLGLELVPGRAQVAALVIDHVNRPSDD